MHAQNWVLGRTQDALLIILAPVIALALGIVAIRTLGVANGVTVVLLTHVVFTVAHHLPTFIRIYGDVELFRRFEWRFVHTPVIVFGFALGVLLYIHSQGLPLDAFLYLYILLTLWDPWHFMRQHYGFMRIYDRHNAAPRWLAARLDLALSASWFAYILIASGDWLVDLLADMNARMQWPLLLWLSHGEMQAALSLARVVALAVTTIYVAYVLWCRRKGYFVSLAKLWMCAATFGVMYLTYTPNALIAAWAPGWSFKVGFAVIGIVHMTQYLAIVWRHNRTLADQPGRARAGIFRWWHARAAWWAGAGYVALCLLYGEAVTTVWHSEWLLAVLLAVGFTSTLTHYYFDGFIWKLRQREADAPAKSSAMRGFARQALLFGTPLGVWTLCAATAWHRPEQSIVPGEYVATMYAAQTLNGEGYGDRAEGAARDAYRDMQIELPVARKLAELQPTASNLAQLAFLLYNESLYEHVVLPRLDEQTIAPQDIEQHRANVSAAAFALSRALEAGGPVAHRGRERLTGDEAKRILASWRRQVG